MHARRVFPQLPLGSHATLGILGNHDYDPAWADPKVADRLVASAASVGVRVLRNEVAEVDGLQIAGLDDLWANRFEPVRTFAALDLQEHPSC